MALVSALLSSQLERLTALSLDWRFTNAWAMPIFWRVDETRGGCAALDAECGQAKFGSQWSVLLPVVECPQEPR